MFARPAEDGEEESFANVLAATSGGPIKPAADAAVVVVELFPEQDIQFAADVTEREHKRPRPRQNVLPAKVTERYMCLLPQPLVAHLVEEAEQRLLLSHVQLVMEIKCLPMRATYIPSR